MESDLHCPICTNQYGADNVPRLLVSCGHTFCHQCLDTLIIEQENQVFRLQCPLDRSLAHLNSNDVSQFPKNITLIKLIERKKAAAAEFKEDSSLEITKIQKNEESHGNQSWQQIINQIGSEEPVNTKQQIQQNKSQNKSQHSNKSQNQKSIHSEKVSSIIRKEDEYCIVHQKPLQIYCLLDLQKICSSCAIFGQHKGHQFKSIEQIDQESNNFRLDLFKIYDQIQQIKKRVYNQQNVKQIVSVLDHKRKKIIKEVGDRYRKLREKIKKNQEMVLKQIDDICGITERQIKEMICIDKKLMMQYQSWQADIFSKLQVMQEGGFTQKIEILYGGNEEDILLKGESTLNKIRLKENSMINQIEHVINTIKTQFNEEIYSVIDNFTIIKLVEIKAKEKETNHYDNLMEQSLLEYENNQVFIEAKTFNNESYSSHEEMVPQKSVFIENNKFISNKYESKIIETKVQKTSTNNKLKSMLNFNGTMGGGQFQAVEVQPFQRPPKKKLKSIKVPEKVEKILEILYNDALEILDLTNAQLGDNVILQICQFLRCSRVRTVKFIRNKLTDDGILKMIPSLGGVITLNISQNYLTQQTLIHLANHRNSFPLIKNIIVSQNKINERKHKQHIERLKNMDLNLSI